MAVVLIFILAIAILGAAAAIFNRVRQGDDMAVTKAKSSCATCDGQSTKCEQVCMMEAATKPVEYYNDEELDSFRGRPSNGYTDDETEQFREVLYTMRQDEVAGWNRSLTLREINVPDQIKDELLLLIGS